MRIIPVAAAALMLVACAQPVKPIQAWAPATAAQASIASVTITSRNGNVPEENLQALKLALEQKTTQCAVGQTKYEMHVRVDNFKLANSGMVMLLGDNHEVAGEVKLVNPADNSVAAEYYVQEITSGGGLIGLAKLSGGARAISTDFASSVCEKVFLKKV
ncbi:MAG: hypothetical protein EPO67_21970 [Reyranella sp.]|jgi:hypothetical protein|nr:MAG: hypothetical protein EPO67_21970 [Reyranella sp.]